MMARRIQQPSVQQQMWVMAAESGFWQRIERMVCAVCACGRQQRRALQGPSLLPQVGCSPPRILRLLEDCHDLFDHCAERITGVLSPFDQIAALLHVLIQGDEFTGFIFLD